MKYYQDNSDIVNNDDRYYLLNSYQIPWKLHHIKYGQLSLPLYNYLNTPLYGRLRAELHLKFYKQLYNKL